MAFGLKMDRFLYMVAGLGVVLAGCSTGFTPADDAAIRGVMAAQERAWDRGDIDGFMQGYGDSICFVGRNDLNCGKAEVTAHYKKTYPDKAAMGDLAFGITEILQAGGDHAWLTGNWKLERSADTVGGGFSLLWERQQDGWRIIRDHTY